MMNLKTGKIVDVQLVQSNEVTSSSAMEKEGLVRSIASLRESGVSINTLVTDRHSQIRKWMKDNLADVHHKYDIWHISKSLNKKLKAAANLSNCASIKPWIQSITNHLYWCAISTPYGNAELKVAKWKSIASHIQNIHSGHDDLFPECLHGPLVGRERKKKWMVPGSKATQVLLPIILNPRLCQDVKLMSETFQTSKLEAFHSTLNHFAPKMNHFSYWGQKCRTLVAAMHYNENGGRIQATTNDGEKCFGVAFPKFKKGGFVVKPVYVEQTFKYADAVMAQVMETCAEGEVHHLEAPPSALCSHFEHPNKQEAVALHRSRFV
ncbi:uncharacterized protein LOC117104488 [Anneissia japonica]|uniref:uncharacterized protein LOC117104488 n=1 Tax=Anneissia japonica TaxID=1529436 RepID=UPI0014256B71|nr:uncharacterized protein LOC117104488 [Anneissia japonica]